MYKCIHILKSYCMYTLTIMRKGAHRKVYVQRANKRLTVCVGLPGWHRSECAGRWRGHTLSKWTYEGQRWMGDGQMSQLCKDSKRRKGWREEIVKVHIKSACCMSVCHMSVHNIKQPQAELAFPFKPGGWGWGGWWGRYLMFSCFHFKRNGCKMYSHISDIEAVCWGKLLYTIKRKKIITLCAT